MGSVARGFGKLSSEMLEYMEDKIAALRVAGKTAEAAEEEAKLARLKKNYAAEAKNASLDEVASEASDAAPLGAAGAGRQLAADPVPQETTMTPPKDTWGGQAPEAPDASDWGQPLDTGAARKRRLAPGLAAGAAGLALTGDSRSPDALPALPGEQPAPAQAEQPPAEMAMAAKVDKPSADIVKMPEIKNILSTLAEPSKAPGFDDWNVRMAGLSSQRQSLVNQFKDEIATAKAAAAASESSLERRELIETITNAVGQIATGMYGLKTGMDLSGTKFNRTDWNAKLDRVRAKLRDDVAILTAQQQLDQSVINEKKDALMQEKDNMLKSYENDLRRWQAKASVAQARQGLETDKARIKVDVEKANAENQRKMEEAMLRAQKSGADVKNQIGAGLKQADMDKKNLETEWNRLAVKAGDKKLSDEQRAAVVQQMESIDRAYTELNGYPLLMQTDEKGNIVSLEPQDYSAIDPEDVSAKMQSRFKSVEKLKQAVSSFQAPQLQKLKDTYVANPDAYITQFAMEDIQNGEVPNIAFKNARLKYRQGLQNMFQIEEADRKYKRSLSGGT